VIISRCILQVLEDMPDGVVSDGGQQPIVKGDVLDLSLDGYTASLGQRSRGHALALPLIGRDREAQAYHLPLNRCGMASFGLDNVDEGPDLARFLDDGTISRLSLALVVQRFQQDSF